MLSQLSKFFYLATKYIALIGMIALLIAALVTSVDVIFREIDGEGIYGAIDLVQLAIMTAAYLSIPFTFMKRAHVAVSMITDNFSRKIQAICQLVAMLLASLFMGVVAYFGFRQASQQFEYGDVSMVVGMPMVYYWVPLIAGSAISFLVTIHIIIESIHVVVKGRSGQIDLEEE